MIPIFANAQLDFYAKKITSSKLRAANEMVQVWDSVIVKDHAGNYTSKTLIEYDSRGNETLERYYYWNNAISNWMEEEREEYQYDSKNNVTLHAYYYGDEENGWSGYKYEYEYDENNNQTLLIYYNRNSDDNSWEETSKNKYEYQYDSRKNKILETIFYYRNAEWIEDVKFKYENE
jgi:hypothetical protein